TNLLNTTHETVCGPRLEFPATNELESAAQLRYAVGWPTTLAFPTTRRRTGRSPGRDLLGRLEAAACSTAKTLLAATPKRVAMHKQSGQFRSVLLAAAVALWACPTFAQPPSEGVE